MATRENRPVSALAALSAGEKAAVLDELLAARSDLRQLVETHAVQLMSAAGRTAVTADVAGALRSLDIEELNGRAGYQRGRGYVHPVEAAGEILDEAMDPFLRDLARRAALGMATAATELAVGILLGLYKCRDGAAKPCWNTPRTIPPNALRMSWTGARNSTSTCPARNSLIS